MYSFNKPTTFNNIEGLFYTYWMLCVYDTFDSIVTRLTINKDQY